MNTNIDNRIRETLSPEEEGQVKSIVMEVLQGDRGWFIEHGIPGDYANPDLKKVKKLVTEDYLSSRRITH